MSLRPMAKLESWSVRPHWNHKPRHSHHCGEERCDIHQQKPLQRCIDLDNGSPRPRAKAFCLGLLAAEFRTVSEVSVCQPTMQQWDQDWTCFSNYTKLFHWCFLLPEKEPTKNWVNWSCLNWYFHIPVPQQHTFQIFEDSVESHGHHPWPDLHVLDVSM